MTGQLIADRYLLEEPLGVGGMAQVYKASDVLLNRTVTVKILKQELSEDSDFVDSFNHEAKSAASLNHPNVVSVYDVGEENGIHYIVMEYIDGIDVQELIDKNGPIAWQYAVDIFLQVGLAIENAHQHNLIHRDIKPKNILLTREGKIKVTDFGIAVAMNSSTINLSTSNMGSVHYFSPEQAQARPVDERSDIYSLGISMYETLTGKVPFDGDTPVAIALKHIKEAPVPPRDVNGEIPQGLNDIVLKCIEKNPKNRYQTMGELIDDIRSIMEDPAYDIAFQPTAVPGSQTGKGSKNGKDDEDSDEKDAENDASNKGMAGNIARIAIAVAILLAIGGSVFYVVKNVLMPSIISPEKNTYVVEDFTGKDYSEVEAQLKNIGVFSDASYEYSSTVAEGIIIRQKTPVGDEIARYSSLVRVQFVVSMGPQYVEIPDDLAGRDRREVETFLTSYGLNCVFEEAFSADIQEGLVCSTEPDAGSRAVYGSTITVFISKGPAVTKIKVPDIAGMSQREAHTELVKAGLKVGTIAPDLSQYVDYTAVVDYTTPAIGTEVEPDTAVDLYMKLIKGTDTDDPTPTATAPGEETLDPDKYITQKKSFIIRYNAEYVGAEGIKLKVLARVFGDDSAYVIHEQVYRYSEFPLTLDLDVPFNVKGRTKVEVYAENELVDEFSETYKNEVPDAVGKEVQSTVEMLETMGIKVELINEYSNTVPKDRIIRLSPAPGTSLKEGDTVKITVSKGVKTSVPSVIGKTYNQAVAALKAAGFTVGNTSTKGGKFYTTVSSQNPAPNSNAGAGDPIDLEFDGITVDTVPAEMTIDRPAGLGTTDEVTIEILVKTADGVIDQSLYSNTKKAYELNYTVTLDVPVSGGDSEIVLYINDKRITAKTVKAPPATPTPAPTEAPTAEPTEVPTPEATEQPTDQSGNG